MLILDASKMTTREDAWAEIRTVLEIPDYFGNNLDALYDVLTTTRAEIRLTGACKMLNALGSYGCRILGTFFDAAQANPYFSFTVGHHD